MKVLCEAPHLPVTEIRKLDKMLRFEDFIKEEDLKLGKKPFNKVKSFKDYCVEISEDYIHSFIDEHEPDHEIDEEE